MMNELGQRSDCQRHARFGLGTARRWAPLRTGMRGKKVEIAAGRTYGNLTAVAFFHKNANGTYWTFRCGLCNREKPIRAADVVGGKQKTCGCVHVTHGATRGRKCSPTYMSWRGMLARCENPNATGYENYGGRGIKICERWHDFAHFLADMGERPKGTEIDRINNDKGYEPGNCQWSTRTEQNRNKRNVRMLTVGDETMCLRDWARRYDIDESTLTRRIDKLGWDVERAVKTPVRPMRKSKAATASEGEQAA